MSRRAPVLELCPVCGKELEPAKHRYGALAQWLSDSQPGPFNTNEKIESGFMVRCPECGSAYASEKLRGFFGLITMGQYKALLVVLCAGMLVFALGTALRWF